MQSVSATKGISSETSHKLLTRKRSFQSALVLTTAMAMASLVWTAPHVFAQAAISTAERTDFKIGPQPLAQALVQFSNATAVQLFFNADLVRGINSFGVQGSRTNSEALDILIAGSGLTYKFTNAHTVTILKAIASSRADTVDAGATDLAPITLQSGESRTSDPYAGMINPPTTVGSKTAVDWKELPQTADVVTQQQIKQQTAQSLDQVLRNTPGVTVYQSDSDRAQYYSRGFPISAMQIDGVPVVMNSDMSSTTSTNAPNLAMYDRVEVLDGPSGLYNGLGTVGGTINLVRKRAPSEFQASTDLTAGTYSNFNGTADIGGPLNPEGTIRGRFVASGQTQDLRQDGRWRHDQAYYGTIEADLTADTLARIGASYMQRDSNIGWANYNETYAGTSNVAGSPSGYYGASWNHNRYATTDAFASVEHTFDTGWKVTASGDFTYDTARVFSGELFSTVDPTTNLSQMGTTNTDYWGRNEAFDLNASGPYSLFEREHEVTVGVNYTHMYNHGTSYYGPGGNDFFFSDVNISKINFPQPTWDKLPTDTDKNVVQTSQVGLYGNTRYHITDALTAVGGARISWWNTSFTPDSVYNYDNYANTKNSYSAKITPYGGLIYDLTKTYSVYASYSTVFQPQTVYSRDGSLVAPMEGDQYEVGVKGSYFEGALNASLSLFQITQKNRATVDPTDPTNSYYIAQGKSRSRGIDIRVSGEVIPDWTVFTGYTYNNSKYLDQDSFDTAASDFSQIAPKHLFKLWTNYKLPGELTGWEIGGGVNATSELYYGSGATRISQSSYFTADARIAYNFDDKTSIALNGTNIFNKLFYQPNNSGVVYGDPRRVMLTLHKSW
jgi:outer membrane receptor for ferric coprogen and ferric-rhodotorulic acid